MVINFEHEQHEVLLICARSKKNKDLKKTQRRFFDSKSGNPVNENFGRNLKVCIIQIVQTCPRLCCEGIKTIAQKI